MIYNFTNHAINQYQMKDLVAMPGRKIPTFCLVNNEVRPVKSIPTLKPLNSYSTQSPSYTYDGVLYAHPSASFTTYDFIPLTLEQIRDADSIVVSRKYAEDIEANRNHSPFMFELTDKLFVVEGKVMDGDTTIGCVSLKKFSGYQVISYYAQQFRITGRLNNVIRLAYMYYLERRNLLQTVQEQQDFQMLSNSINSTYCFIDY